MCEDIYGEAQIIEITLWKNGEPVSNPTLAASDFSISIDGGAFGLLDNIPTVAPAGSVLVEISLTAAEKTGERITIMWADPDEEWEPNGITIYTCEALSIESTYQAKIEFFDDDENATDRYVVTWFKDSEPITSGITVPTLQVIKVADGTDLIAQTAMSQIGALGMYRYNAVLTQRIVSGIAYIAHAEATIDGDTRKWNQPFGRDS